MMAATLNFEDWLALTQLHADYASAVDSGNWDLWPEFFTEDGVYRLQPRENHERGLPLASRICELLFGCAPIHSSAIGRLLALAMP